MQTHSPYIPCLGVEDEAVRIGVWASVVEECVLLLCVAVTALVATVQTQPDHRHIVVLMEGHGI